MESLRDLEESPWANFAISLTVNKLAWYLKPFGIRSKQIRIGDNKKSYMKESFDDAWARYLAPSGGDSGETGEPRKLGHTYEPNETTASVNGNVSDGQQEQSVPNVSDVSAQSGGC